MALNLWLSMFNKSYKYDTFAAHKKHLNKKIA